VRDEPVPVEPVQDHGGVLLKRRGENDNLVLGGEGLEELVDAGALQDVEIHGLAVDDRPDDEVEALRRRRGVRVDERFVEVEEHRFSDGEQRREERGGGGGGGGVVEHEGSANVVEFSVGCCSLFEDFVGGCFFLVGAGAEARDLREEFRDTAADGGQRGGGSRHHIFYGGFPSPATVVVVAEVLDGLHWASLHL